MSEVWESTGPQVEVATVAFDQWQLIETLRTDGEFFIQFYLGEMLEFPVPKFHLDCWDRLVALEIQKLALALPRGHAKTTLAKLACVWYILFSQKSFIVYLSNTHTIAAAAVKDIVDFLQCDNHRLTFGPLNFHVEQSVRGVYHFSLQVPDGPGKWREKTIILRAFGAEQQVRGLNVDNRRPELAVVDDLEDRDNTATKALQDKLSKWFFGAFMKAMSKKDFKVLYLGNMLSNKSILYLLCTKLASWHHMRLGALLSSGDSLWPELWPVKELKADYLEYQQAGQAALWFAEMMNLPMNEGAALIDPADITYQPPVIPGQQACSFITVDPAISQKTWANDTAINVHAYVADRWQIVETVAGKFTPERVFFILVELALKWQTRVVGIEAGAFELGLKFIFEILSKTTAQEFEVYSIPHANRSKTERLTVWCGLLRKQLWTLTEGDQAITGQLIAYNPLSQNNDDDVIDSCAMGVTMTEMYLPAIMASYSLVPENVRTVTRRIDD